MRKIKILEYNLMIKLLKMILFLFTYVEKIFNIEEDGYNYRNSTIDFKTKKYAMFMDD